MKNFLKSLSNFFYGPFYNLWNEPKKKVQDKTNFIAILSLIFSLLFYSVFRIGVEVFLKDIGNSFKNIFTNFGGAFAYLIILFIVATPIVSLLLAKFKKVLVCKEMVLTTAFIYVLYLFLCITKTYEVNQKNWLLWLVMSIPTFVLLFDLAIYAFRLVAKIVNSFSSVTEARLLDYQYKTEYRGRFFKRLGLYFKDNWGQVLSIIALICLAAAVLYPLCILLIRSIKEANFDLAHPFEVPTKFSFDSFRVAWEMLKDSFLNSLITSIAVTLGTMICASLLAFAFIRFRFPGKSILFYAIIGLMMIPGILTLISRFQLVKSLGLMDDAYNDSRTLLQVYGGIVLPGIAGYIPMSFMLLFTFFNGIPKDLFEAADVDGANNLSVYLKIVTPLSKPILSTIAIQTFVGEWNDYLWAYLVHGDFDEASTLPVMLQSMSQLAEQTSIPYTVVFAGYVLSAIPLILIFIVASKQFIEGLTSGAFKM